MGAADMVPVTGSHGRNSGETPTQPKPIHQTNHKRATPEVPQKRQMAHGGILHQPPTNRPTYFSTTCRLKPYDWRELTSGIHDQRVSRDILRGLATDTQRTYQTYWRHWVTFCSEHAPGHAADQHTITRFIDWLHYDMQWATASIRSALGGLATVHALTKLGTFEHNTKLIALYLKGIARQEPKTHKGGTILASDWVS